MPSPKIVVVTGANRGIGQAICKLILSRPDVTPLKLFAASRKGEDIGFASLTNSDPQREILYPKLDVSSRESITALADEVKREGLVDVLINNAGVNLDARYGFENARTTLDVNYRGVREMCHAFLPIMAKGGRIVNMSSVGSSLKPYSEAMRQRFRNPNASQEDLDQLAEDFLKSVQTSTENASGFGPPQRSYSISKSLINALTALLARENPHLAINCCCPGWIATDMGRLVGSGNLSPPKTPEQGAAIPVRLGFGDIRGESGRYWANANVRSKGEGEVQEW
ncbi:NAD(P)-binding protein [Hortaea werneckii]|uniref:NAD(P)-binding protein n=1 Tax=Hortaea werneckii EXF-2000 TaxID=1157616 RepID=A0A1Z5TU87_HORWE|nr:NAD(P)-binding protein [Hortaea werneckii]OTA39566.1 hypothetical protein BTJ68_00611 [Hortaea werneckii EXF-2000]KAI6821008.1 NAD(P)-binding protein [Hortaea werneckii]KAI6899905.1 NAD(P)-binding protein [Hortaea werneckii]KAI6920218.1 NAD(P)-binding protein [Hortaea werneckii]